MDGLECRRCKQPDVFQEVCDECDEKLQARVDKLLANAACVKYMAGVHVERWHEEPESSPAPEQALEHINRLESEWSGWIELAEMQNRMWFDEAWWQKQVMDAIEPKGNRFVGRDM
tara:strand:+ start:1854 stop:2201 length:348 start_codon:yes stop_codon:yes gene_type:complete